MPLLPPLPSLSSLRRSCDVAELGGPLDHNPVFDKPNRMPDISSLPRTETNNSSSVTQTGVYFVNPSCNKNETNFNAISGLQ